MKINLHVAAANLSKKIRGLTVVVLNRPRQEALIKEIRDCGARIKTSRTATWRQQSPQYCLTQVWICLWAAE